MNHPSEWTTFYDDERGVYIYRREETGVVREDTLTVIDRLRETANKICRFCFETSIEPSKCDCFECRQCFESREYEVYRDLYRHEETGVVRDTLTVIDRLRETANKICRFCFETSIELSVIALSADSVLSADSALGAGSMRCTETRKSLPLSETP